MTVLAEPGAFALRAIRVSARRNMFINYEAITFPKDPAGGCDLYLRRARICGLAEGGEGPLGIDVLDRNGDIIQTFTVSRRAFEYLRRCLRFRREQSEESAQSAD